MCFFWSVERITTIPPSPFPFPCLSLRVWYSLDRSRGLVVRADHGTPLIDAPAAVLTAVRVPRDAVPACVPRRATVDPADDSYVIAGHTITLVDDTMDGDTLGALVRAARAAWREPRHAGWRLLTSGGRTFESMEQMMLYIMRPGGVRVDGEVLVEAPKR